MRGLVTVEGSHSAPLMTGGNHAKNSTPTTTDAAPRQTKQQIMIDLLRRPEGAGIEEITAATGWQSHTVRGAMSGALKKKLGLEITSKKVEGLGRVYRIER